VIAPTPSQTIGPFFRFGLAWMDATHLVDERDEGGLVLHGRVVDGSGDPVPDAVIEICQSDPMGAFPSGWTGFGRCLADESGAYAFVTVRPGPLGDGSAPHVDVSVFARGLLQRVVTRLYMPGTDIDAPDDPVLASVPRDRRATLVAETSPIGLRFDIRLQGEQETVFFAW